MLSTDLQAQQKCPSPALLTPTRPRGDSSVVFDTNPRTSTRKVAKAYREGMSELILLVDGAGGGHSTAIVSHNGDVGCTGIVSSVIHGLVVVNRMGGVVCDFPPQTIRKELGCHVSDCLSEKSSAVTQQI